MILEYDVKYLTRNGLHCFLVAEDQGKNNLHSKKCVMVSGDIMFNTSKYGNASVSSDHPYDIVGKVDA